MRGKTCENEKVTHNQLLSLNLIQRWSCLPEFIVTQVHTVPRAGRPCQHKKDKGKGSFQNMFNDLLLFKLSTASKTGITAMLRRLTFWCKRGK